MFQIYHVQAGETQPPEPKPVGRQSKFLVIQINGSLPMNHQLSSPLFSTVDKATLTNALFIIAL